LSGCLGICGDAAILPGGMARHSHSPALAEATSTCRNPPRRQGPPALMVTDGIICQATCRCWLWRQVGAVVGPGSTCHVSPGQTCRHPGVVSFDKKFQRWSFLLFHWCRWSNASKIHLGPATPRKTLRSLRPSLTLIARVQGRRQACQSVVNK
jgi:hypothetical protein